MAQSVAGGYSPSAALLFTPTFRSMQLPYEYKAWPAWRYGPGGQAAIFETEDDVPEGWVDHPSKVVEPSADDVPTKNKGGRPPKSPATDLPPSREDAISAIRKASGFIADDATNEEVAAVYTKLFEG